MRYFDCLCEIGPRNQKDPAAPWSVKDLLFWMDHCGIAGALVVHTLSIHNDPVEARSRLAEETAKAPGRLFPVWTLLPPHAGDFEQTPAAVLSAMKQHDIRAVKLLPMSHNYPLSETVIGPLLEALQEQQILTLIDMPQVAVDLTDAFEKLDRLLSQFPRLPLLLQRFYWDKQRMILPLMQRHDNLHIEFSNYQIWRGPEQYVHRFGPDRLLFGSGLPDMSGGAARAYIDYADIPQEAKEKIAGDNLSRLLKGLVPDADGLHDPDPLRDRAAAGQPLTESPVLDAHCHILHEDGQGAGRIVMRGGDADGLVALKDMTGVCKTAIMSWSGPAASDLRAGNDIVSRAIKKYPQRFVGLVYVNPAHWSQEELMEELHLRIEHEGFGGAKPYFQVGLRYDDPMYTPVWEYLEKRHLYALLHLREGVTGYVEVVSTLAERYPNTQWVVAHTGGEWSLARDVVGVMKQCSNIWAELTYTTVRNGIIEWMASQVGDERILFGTDAPMRDPRPQLGWVIWADLPLQSRRRILGENFARLLAMAEQSSS